MKEERDAIFKASDKYEPVVIGIWDTGVDMEIFPESNRWMNKNEVIDGKDNDNNGYVDSDLAKEFKKKAGEMTPEEYEQFFEILSLWDHIIMEHMLPVLL